MVGHHADQDHAGGIWLDLSNPADIPFFLPIVEELEREGQSVTLTVRDFGATVSLAREHFPAATIIGEWGRRLPAKGAALARRTGALVRFARGRDFSLALSLNSYAQIAAARMLRIRPVTTMDYEGQPANHLAFRLADTVLVPEVFPDEALRRFGARRVQTYPGIKEQVYMARPGAPGDIRAMFGAADRILAVLRPPPDFSAYHQFENPLFEQAVNHLLAAPDTLCVLIPRTPRQAEWAKSLWPERVVIPDRVLPNVDLLWGADLVVGAGGTMNREAAVIGTPTYSLFAGQATAVDRYLTTRGLMTLVADATQLRCIQIRRKPSMSWPPASCLADQPLPAIVDRILDRVPPA